MCQVTEEGGAELCNTAQLCSWQQILGKKNEIKLAAQY